MSAQLICLRNTRCSSPFAINVDEATSSTNLPRAVIDASRLATSVLGMNQLLVCCLEAATCPANRHWPGEPKLRSRSGTPVYMAPEVVLQVRTESSNVDDYARDHKQQPCYFQVGDEMVFSTDHRMFMRVTWHLERVRKRLALLLQDYDEQADVWSVGILMWQLLTGRFPFWDDIKSLSLQQARSRAASGRHPSCMFGFAYMRSHSLSRIAWSLARWQSRQSHCGTPCLLSQTGTEHTVQTSHEDIMPCCTLGA